MLWNEPNNVSHWDFEVDGDWKIFSGMLALAGAAVRAENPTLTRVLGGISPIDPAFVTRLAAQGALDQLDAVAVHGFPLDWNHWQMPNSGVNSRNRRAANLGLPCSSSSPRWKWR